MSGYFYVLAGGTIPGELLKKSHRINGSSMGRDTHY